MPKKRFQFMSMSNSLAMTISRPSSSDVIYKTVLTSIEAFASRDWMKGRFLDLSVFKRTGPFIKWHELLEDQLTKPR
jgi:hypothetical protein